MAEAPHVVWRSLPEPGRSSGNALSNIPLAITALLRRSTKRLPKARDRALMTRITVMHHVHAHELSQSDLVALV